RPRSSTSGPPARSPTYWLGGWGAASTVTPRDLVLCVFTGGSSALACLPAEGIPFAAKAELHRLLIASGIPIEENNAVRKHTSAIKGGLLARAMGAATIVNLTVPDVVSGRLDCITDLTVEDRSTVREARQVLQDNGLWDAVAPEIRAHLQDPSCETPTLTDQEITTVLVCTAENALQAMAASAADEGFIPIVFGNRIEGEASTVGRVLASIAIECFEQGRPFPVPCMMLGAGGEMTVKVDPDAIGGPGHKEPSGGPNQEAALAFAQALPADSRIAAGFLDSDGSDGGGTCAGAIVDALTAERIQQHGRRLSNDLAEHRSTAALSVAGDCVVTGPTGTNVSDIWAVAVGPGRAFPM
ncbi:DUF4147 domain-containing protein, partial [Nocardia sp. NPDC004722]